MSGFFKWKCAHCGKMEYRSSLFSHPPYKGVCKKGKKAGLYNLGHTWINTGYVEEKPKGK